MLTVYSCNVNGIRAAVRKGFLGWLEQTQPDILCLQETRCIPEELPPELRTPEGYVTYWEQSSRKGYSGVALFSRKAPIDVRAVTVEGAEEGTGGRVLSAEYDAFQLVNVYVPSRENTKRWPQKQTFLLNLLTCIRGLSLQGKPVIVCGDFNIAHQPLMDILPPQGRKRHVSLLAAETRWVDDLLACGFADAFRRHLPEAAAYTWKQPNPTWRLDYIFVNEGLCPLITGAGVHTDVQFSDHCSVSVTFEM